MQGDWAPLEKELAIWRNQSLDLPIWWRDDDVTAQTDALDTLVRMSDDLGLPVHLAVIPDGAEVSLVTVCAGQANLVPMVHGWAHQNHSPPGEKKAEFGHPRDGLVADATKALTRMRELFGPGFLEIFVPPWNRIDPSLVTFLGDIGYRGLSTFTSRKFRQAAPGLVQINTHIDPIHWRAGGGLVPIEQQIAGIVSLLQDRSAGQTDKTEPLGLLTHHLVHDPSIWAFTERFLSFLLDGGARPVNLADGADHLP